MHFEMIHSELELQHQFWTFGKTETRMSLKGRAQEKVERAGISNYSFDHDVLVMCGVRYTIEACDCGQSDCDGVPLRKNITAIGRVLQ